MQEIRSVTQNLAQMTRPLERTGRRSEAQYHQEQQQSSTSSTTSRRMRERSTTDGARRPEPNLRSGHCRDNREASHPSKTTPKQWQTSQKMETGCPHQNQKVERTLQPRRKPLPRREKPAIQGQAPQDQSWKRGKCTECLRPLEIAAGGTRDMKGAKHPTPGCTRLTSGC